MTRSCAAYLVVFLCCSSGHLAVAQQWETVDVRLLKEQKAKSDELQAAMTSMEMQIDFTSYRSKTDVVPHERVVAELVRDKESFRSTVGTITTIQVGAARVVIDKVDRSILLTDPVPLEDMSLQQLSAIVLDRVVQCSRRRTVDGMEYRIQWPAASLYDQQLLLFDNQGWLRRTETTWRQGIQEDPGNLLSPVHYPRLVAQYGRPLPLRPERRADLDLSKVYRATTAGIVAVAPWTGYEVIDTRINP